MKQISIRSILFLSFLFFVADCRKASTDPNTGTVTFVVGTVYLLHGDQKHPVRISQEVQDGDVLVTEKGSLVTVTFGENASLIEIQSESEFEFDATKGNKLFTQKKGGSWILSNKLQKGEGLTLTTPTTTAGVRGTKFFTSIHKDLTLVCHCEGQIELENKQGHSKVVNESDYLSVTRGNKTVYLTGEDLKKENLPAGHDHSEISNSALGGQNTMTSEQFEVLLKIAEKKFAAIR